MADESELHVPCEVYSRVVGYLRPVRNWHRGKRREFEERVTFDVENVAEDDDKGG